MVIAIVAIVVGVNAAIDKINLANKLSVPLTKSQILALPADINTPASARTPAQTALVAQAAQHGITTEGQAYAAAVYQGHGPSTPAAPPTTAAPQVITMTLTGSGTANSVTIIDGTGESQQENIPLPYTTTTPLAGTPEAEIEGQNGPTGSISCQLGAPGYVPITNTSSGAYAVVDCGAKF
jgi:hypothetical protein